MGECIPAPRAREGDLEGSAGQVPARLRICPCQDRRLREDGRGAEGLQRQVREGSAIDARRRAPLMAVPALAVFAAFWLLPMARLVQVGGSGKDGFGAYFAVLTNVNYFKSLVSTIALSA